MCRFPSTAIRLALLCCALCAPLSQARGGAWVDPALRAAQQAAGPQELVPIRVVLRHDDLRPPGPNRRRSIADRQQRVLSAVPAAADSIVYRHESLSGFAASVPPHAIDALARHSEVSSIHSDKRVHATLAQGSVLIGADVVHAAGTTGSGIVVAVLDTGIDTDHPNLADDLVAQYCSCNDHPNPFRGCCPDGSASQSGTGAAEDGNGHGTSVAGIITSAHPTHLGVAPDAGVVAIKVLSNQGSGFNSGIDAGLDWVLTNYATYGIRIVNMSLGDSTEQNDPTAVACSTDPTSIAIAALHAVGIATFVASGNDGHDDGISAPACTSEAISVGGVYDQALGSVGWCGDASCSTILCTDASAVDGFVCHTNSDEILDLLAPDFRTGTPTVGGGINTSFGGTSAASPYAAGQAALLLEQDPTLLPEQIRSLLKTNGPSVIHPDTGLSFTRSDVRAALLALTCGNGEVDPGEDCDASAGDACCTPSCSFEASSTPCDDGSLCTSSDACDGAGACGGATIDCDDGNLCTDDSCDPGFGCAAVANTAPCDEGDSCTVGDGCSNGACSPGSPVSCDDANLCTDDSCDSVFGCLFMPNTAACDDGDACTTGDICGGGACIPGLQLTCDDSNVCTNDLCDPILGCEFVPNVLDCSDRDACTSGDVCAGGSCLAGSLLDCDDGDPCTADGCDGITGCFHETVAGCATPEIDSLSGGTRALLLVVLISASLLLIPRFRE